MSEILPISEEQQELQEIKDHFYNAPKFSRWYELFFDKDNSYGLDTFRDQTLSAIIAYELDPSNKDDRKYAQELGCKNTRKCKNFAQKYYETTGFTKTKTLDLIAGLAVKGHPSALKIFVSLQDIYQERPNVLIQNNIQNNQTNNLNTTVHADDPRIDQLNRDFQEFIEAKYKKVNPQPVITETSG